MPPPDQTVGAGDLRRAATGDTERLVLVLATNPARNLAQITLIHPYTEYATGNDVIVAPDRSGVTYPVVVQTALRGTAALTDLGPLLAVLPADVVTACLRSDPGLANGPGLSTGSRWHGPLEARAEFKDHERRTLARLARIGDPPTPQDPCSD